MPKPIWNYFKPSADKKFASCLQPKCKREDAIPTANWSIKCLELHLKNHHKELSVKYLGEKLEHDESQKSLNSFIKRARSIPSLTSPPDDGPSTSSKDIDEISIISESSDRDPNSPAPSPSASFSNISKQLLQQHAQGQAALPFQPAKLTAARIKVIDRRIVELIAMDYEPFRIVDRDGFRRFVETLEPRYQIRSREYYRARMLDTYKAVRLQVQTLVANAPAKLSFTTDIWSDSTSHKDLMRYLVLATYLDPRFKNRYWSSTGTKARVHSWIIADLSGDASATTEEAAAAPEPTVPQSAKGGVWTMFASFSETRVNEDGERPTAPAENSQIKTEITLYENEPFASVNDPGFNLFVWWSHARAKFPYLATLARRYLACPPTTVPSERLFSKAGMLYTKKRSKLSGEKAEKLLFIKSNLKKINYTY